MTNPTLLISPESFSSLCEHRQERLLEVITILKELQNDDQWEDILRSHHWEQLNKHFSVTAQDFIDTLEAYREELAIYSSTITDLFAPAIYGPPSGFDSDELVKSIL